MHTRILPMILLASVLLMPAACSKENSTRKSEKGPKTEQTQATPPPRQAARIENQQNTPKAAPTSQPTVQGDKDATPADTQSANPRVVLQTTLGDIVLELDSDKAPVTVENFLTYVNEGYFDGTIFHRVMPGFMIQGGGYTPDFRVKSGQHEPIRNEAANGLKNRTGTIAMARLPGPHTATSEFFINLKDNRMLDNPNPDGWGYCVFGKVVEGMDTVDKIKNVKTTFNRMGEQAKPVDPPVIQKARIVE